ncbi:DUF3953 domain-containing protein [Alkalibacillus salilacus]|uniref:DUF3953 domain-containing protein n=1 Tax=Alkalibacillus salilacus TaxID=284582 RepID=UPI0027D7F65F|nr:DUF3953 domain-containing protein [Alkalibacillus salilacus]
MILNIIITVLAITVISGSIYGLSTGEHGLQPYIQLLSGVMFFGLGLKIFQQNQKTTAIFIFLVSGFILFVSIYVLVD